MEEGLEPRKRGILRAVVLEYVSGSEPVGSELLVQKYNLGVKSATVRHELAEMSELGYLEQPHTSAGRIPSDQGYRYFVDNLREPSEPTEEERGKVQLASDRTEVLRAILTETTKVLARLTQQLAAATTLGDTQVKVRSALITAVSPHNALLVVILSNGDVENRMVDLAPGTSLEDLGFANEALSKLLEGMNLRQLSQLKVPTGSRGGPDRLIAMVAPLLRTIGQDLSTAQLVVEGEEYILSQPEMRRDSSLLRAVLDRLEDEEVLTQLVNRGAEGSPLMISIGREHELPGLDVLSVIRHRFTIGDEEAGTLAIIGPTRQDYQHGIAILSFAAQAISDTLSRLNR